MSLPDGAVQFDGYLSLLTVVGLFPTVWSFFKKEKLNPIEDKFYLITTWMSLFFLVRFPFLAFGIEQLAGLVYTAGLILLFCIALYFESLLRRHYPLWFKLYLTLGTVGGIVAANTHLLHAQKGNLEALAIYVISVQLVVLFLCWTRDRKDYTKVENSMISTSTWALIFLGPFFLSDITTFHLPLPKLGVIAALLFAYLSLFDQSLTRHRLYPLWNIIKSAAAALILTLPFFVLLDDQEAWFWSRLYEAFFGLQLSVRIYMAITQLDGDTEMSKFLTVFNEADRSSVLKFLLSFREFYSKVEVKIFRQDAIRDYEMSRIDIFMSDRGICLLSRDRIQSYLDHPADLTPEEQEALDQANDFLETLDMTHFFRVGTAEVYYILLCLPLVHYEKTIEVQAQAITETAALIQKSR